MVGKMAADTRFRYSTWTSGQLSVLQRFLWLFEQKPSKLTRKCSGASPVEIDEASSFYDPVEDSC